MSKAYRIYQELLKDQLIYRLETNSYSRLKYYTENGIEIPEHLLPGRVIMNLADEEREELKKLTSDETKTDRQI